MERFYKKVFLATKECFKIIEESLKCIQGVNLNLEVTWFAIKTCCYDAVKRYVSKYNLIFCIFIIFFRTLEN